MALSHNKRLYDISTRLAIYIEGVKLQQALEFETVLSSVADLVSKLLGKIRYTTLDGLSKAQLHRLIVDLRREQLKIYNKYTEFLIKQLQDFMQADLSISRRIWVSSFLEFDSDVPFSSKLLSDKQVVDFLKKKTRSESSKFLPALLFSLKGDWRTIELTPIGANGFYLSQFLKKFSNSAQSSVENAIKIGWANNLTIAEILKQILGDETLTQGATSELSKIKIMASSVIQTAVSHISSVVSNSTMSVVFDKYVWVSVLDNRTTEICINRNGKVYKFGKGPLPPAHIRCRSHISPLNSSFYNSSFDRINFNSWISEQPERIQNDILGKALAEAVREKKLNEVDIKFDRMKPLTIEQFSSKIDYIY